MQSFWRAIISYYSVGGFVQWLLFWTCPSAIFRTVISVIINTVQRKSFWFTANRIRPFYEVPEIMPFTTDGYAALTVSIIFNVIRIFTSSDHIIPDTVQFIFWPSVFEIWTFSQKTTATFYLSTFELIREKCGSFSTITGANKNRFTFFWFDYVCYG